MKSGKIMLVTLAALFCVFLSACGFSNDETDDPIKNPIPTATATVEPTVEPTETPAPAKSNTGQAKKPSSGARPRITAAAPAARRTIIRTLRPPTLRRRQLPRSSCPKTRLHHREDPHRATSGLTDNSPTTGVVGFFIHISVKSM